MAEGAIFICYRREDSVAYAGRLYDRLEARFGKNRVFMDVDTIEPGEDFVKVIEQKIAACHALIAVIGKSWVSALDDGGVRRLDNPEDYVHLEITAALKRDIRVIPALVGGAAMPRSVDLPEEMKALARRNAIEIDDTAFHHGVARLIETLAPETLASDTQDRRTSAWFHKPLLRTAVAIGVAVLVLFAIPLVRMGDPPVPNSSPAVDTELNGTVIDAVTRRPVLGAILEVPIGNSVDRVMSGATGGVRIGLPATTGLVEIRLSATGYVPLTQYVNVANQDVHVFELKPQAPDGGKPPLPTTPKQPDQVTTSKDPNLILRNFKTMLVNASDARFFGSDQMQAALHTNKDFAALQITIVEDQNVADVILEVGYTFAWDYPFSLTHRPTSIVLVSGKGVGRLWGPEGARSVARELATLLKPYRPSAP